MVNKYDNCRSAFYEIFREFENIWDEHLDTIKKAFPSIALTKIEVGRIYYAPYWASQKDLELENRILRTTFA